MFKRYTAKGLERAIDKGNTDKITDYLTSPKGDQFADTVLYDGIATLNYTLSNWGSFNTFVTVIESGKVDATQKQCDGEYPLSIIIKNGDKKHFNYIIEKMTIDDLNVTGYIPHAVKNSQFKMFRTMIEMGADINTQDKKGNTALHIALEQNKTPFIEYLLEHGADTKIRNNAGFTAEHLQEENLSKSTETNVSSENNYWELLNDTSIAHIQNFENINRRITEIFNFKSKERLIISENLKTEAESTTPPESFHTLDISIPTEAFEIYSKKIGKKIPEGINLAVSSMLKSKPPSTNALDK